MNHFEYGFFDELEKIAGPSKTVAALMGALLAGSIGIKGLKDTVKPTAAARQRAVEDFVAKNSQGARTGYGLVTADTARAATRFSHPTGYRRTPGSPEIRGKVTMDSMRRALDIDRIAAAARGLATSPGQYGLRTVADVNK